MRFLRQSLTGVFLASLALALLVWAGAMVSGAIQARLSAERPKPPVRERVFAVNVATARIETVVPVLEAFGQVQSRRSLELRAAAGGRVVWLADGFEEGGTVRAGEVLVRVDPADAEAALDRAESDLLDSQAEERDAERSLVLARDDLTAAEEQAELRDRASKRQEELAGRGVATASAVETAELAAAAARQVVLSRRQAVAQAETRVDNAATRISRARIAREEAERRLADTKLTAPFDATLSGVTLVEGRLVQTNEQLATLVDPQALEVSFQVSTAQYARLLDAEGRLIAAPVAVRLELAGADLVARGRISRDSAGAAEGLTGRVIYARMDAAPGFKPGDFVTVHVDEPPLDNVARLPASALGSDGALLLVGEGDRLESLPVALMRRQGDTVLVSAEGLDGREVVVSRTPLLGAGIRVAPVRPRGAEPAVAAPELLELTSERRARLVAFVEANNRMPAEVKARVLAQLGEDRVPAQLVERIESRMGG
ncbi:efflux RND transporter periplasmic adaptor subunit [Seohaeicola zhoushanensis]|uniref:Hemolysin secretion protein D n=1 Tax=Seohaeicola zhoushanensis TaxID=1569283 RepID=A0A8J3GV65_9RHOB|nr:HlyD family efflux transporter periplasmic adaptor subunit [Seohaeicola zhoushanensis]GHF37623.1 hemolysin secretion protein D [Seohaeicola zhoushanensis]